ncbi:hypothetical protein [Saccharothrix coeruleofusca]|uniref:Uncharacterized protein n=1 Tax=Saccharothrix coeruleofusca TaxID=33919 RepID=A0A918AP50_9PSEU|nr:hypothetical protein [Saccharothrix coeruleofusca]MBP2339326.1 hypothetical protein [Saccharothrix coeruleofusca]GGP58534.1 hypothetical protein GCM10010185_33740 [Saccharothrix coeruleofusca]
MDEGRLREAAFGGDPGAEVWAGLRGTRTERWLAAVVLGARGHYAAAAAALGELLRGDDLVASLAASALASHRRQLGAHAAARRLDAVALAKAPGGAGGDPHGVDPAGARADALLGLAADALGAGRLGEARRLHAAVEPVGWRARVRHGWVAAEIELASGRPEAAEPFAGLAVEAAERAGATRHLLKSRLVLGTALVVRGTPESVRAGLEVLSCDLNHTTDLGLLSLVWPTALVLAEGTAGRNIAESEQVREHAVNALSCVLRRADPISRRWAVASPWIPTALLRSGEPPNADAETNFLTD